LLKTKQIKKSKLKKSDFKSEKKKKKTRPQRIKAPKVSEQEEIKLEKKVKAVKPKRKKRIKKADPEQEKPKDNRLKTFIHRNFNQVKTAKTEKQTRTVAEKIQVIGRSEHSGYLNKEKECFDILKIRGTPGARHLHHGDLQVMIEHFAGGLRSISKPVHFVILDFMVDYSQQISFYRFKMANTENHEYLYWLQKEVDKLSYLQEQTSEEHYFAIVFGETEIELAEQKSLLKRIEALNAEEIPTLEKDALLYKLHNLNSVPSNSLRG
jgi:hypothetical protein